MGGAEVQQDICQYNQAGFCKHGDKCFKYHENELYKAGKCRERMCKMRHPKVCKYFTQTGKCKFNEHCEFAHKESEIATRQSKLELEMLEMNEEFNNILSQKVYSNENDTISIVDNIRKEIEYLKRENAAINNSMI